VSELNGSESKSNILLLLNGGLKVLKIKVRLKENFSKVKIILFLKTKNYHFHLILSKTKETFSSNF